MKNIMQNIYQLLLVENPLPFETIHRLLNYISEFHVGKAALRGTAAADASRNVSLGTHASQMIQSPGKMLPLWLIYLQHCTKGTEELTAHWVRNAAARDSQGNLRFAWLGLSDGVSIAHCFLSHATLEDVIDIAKSLT